MSYGTPTAPVTVIIQQDAGGYNNVPPSKWRNQPQSNAMTKGGLLFITGGFNLAFSFGWYIGYNYTQHLQYCWFIAVMVGAIIAAPLISILQKRFYFLFSCLLVLVSGILFTSAPDDYDVLLAARYLNGFAIGFATIPYLVHAGEVASRSYRGTCLSVEQYSISLGIAVQIIYISQWGIDFDSTRFMGILCIIFAVLAMSSTYLFIESPIFFIRRCNEEAALECLRMLYRPQIVTHHTKAKLQELKNYVIENENLSLVEAAVQGFSPLLKMLFFRSFVAFSFSYQLSLGFIFASAITMGELQSWPAIVFACLRFLGGVVALWVLDGIGRKILSLFSLLVMAGLFLGIGIIYSDYSNVANTHQMAIVCVLSLISQFFGGCYDCTSSAYMGEAFPLLLKPYFMAICIVVQNVIYIITICTIDTNGIQNFSDYNIAIAVIMFVFFLIFCLVLPETRKSSLRDAQQQFRHMFHMRAY